MEEGATGGVGGGGAREDGIPGGTTGPGGGSPERRGSTQGQQVQEPNPINGLGLNKRPAS